MSDWKNVQYKDGKFKTGEGGGGGASALTDLSDVNVSSPSNGQVLKYDNTTSKWVNTNESGGGHIYSTTEQVVGTWIDGKPLYEKCYDITLANGTIGTIDSTFIPKKFEAYMYFSGNNTGDCQSNPFVYDSSNLWTVWIDNRTITGKMHSVYAGKSAVLILQYTKTTDA